MFDDIANTLKVFSKVLLGSVLILTLVACIAILVANNELFLFAIIILIGGIVSALVGSSCLYGFGELIDKATEIANNTQTSDSTKKESRIKSPELFTSSTTNTYSSAVNITADCQNQKKSSDSFWICSHCGHSNPQNVKGCENCRLLK